MTTQLVKGNAEFKSCVAFINTREGFPQAMLIRADLLYTLWITSSAQ